jgi:hypothetical protein
MQTKKLPREGTNMDKKTTAQPIDSINHDREIDAG